jgi:hypothetical protein
MTMMKQGESEVQNNQTSAKRLANTIERSTFCLWDGFSLPIFYLSRKKKILSCSLLPIMRSKLFRRFPAGMIALVASSLASRSSSAGSRALFITAYVSSSSFNSQQTNTVPERYVSTCRTSSTLKITISRLPPFPSSSLLVSSASFSTSTTENNPRPLPTIEQLSTDPFMKQVSYAERVIAECLWIDTKSFEDMNAESAENEKKKNKKLEMLKAQLSHSDGIRGFFVTYLTAMAATASDVDSPPDAVIQLPPADRSHVPTLLVEAMKSSVVDADDLIRLACMNVIMPTGMMTMHTDAELAAQSKITATRAIRILDSLQSIHPTAVQRHVSAIYAVATSRKADDIVETAAAAASADELIEFWTRFFEKWGYQEKQRIDIAAAVKSIMK